MALSHPRLRVSDDEAGPSLWPTPAEEEADARGLGSIDLAVDADNIAARKLYEELGCEALRRRTVKNRA